MKSNIILIGMPGAGKSTIGVILAKVIAFDFIDLDILICKRSGKTLQQILDEDGTEKFLRIERDAALSLSCERCVIATGGSAALIDEAMRHFKANGCVVFLDVPLGEIESRLTNMATRGIAATAGKTVADIYNERMPFYREHSDITVDAGSAAPGEAPNAERVVDSIIRALKNIGFKL